jgi:hypothetical protein
VKSSIKRARERNIVSICIRFMSSCMQLEAKDKKGNWIYLFWSLSSKDFLNSPRNKVFGCGWREWCRKVVPSLKEAKRH